MTDIIFENKEKGFKIRNHQTGSITIEFETNDGTEWKILSPLEFYEMYQSLNELFAKVEITDFPKPDGTIYKHIVIPFNEEKRYLVSLLRTNIDRLETHIANLKEYGVDDQLNFDANYTIEFSQQKLELAKSILKKIEEGKLL